MRSPAPLGDDSRPNWRRLPAAEKSSLLYALFRKRYADDPAGFARDCVRWPEGKGLAPHQAAILDALIPRRRVCVRSPHGAGKTTTAALAVLWFALTRDGTDWKCPTTASAWRHLDKFLWPEIHRWARALDWKMIGRAPFVAGTELLDHSIKLRTGEAFATASDNPALIEGAHADHLLYLYDEAKEIPDAVWDASEGAFAGAGSDTGAEALALAFSTPGGPIGRFHAIQTRDPHFRHWHAIYVSLQECIAAGRISQKWAENVRVQWGEESAVYQQRVLGNFAADATTGVIPLSWITAAQERWRFWRRAEAPERKPPAVVACDPADQGGDDTAVAIRHGMICEEVRLLPMADTMETTGRVLGIAQAHAALAVIDAIGIGAGVFARLRELGHRAAAFVASAGHDGKDRSGELGFANLRAAGWWNLREMLDPASGLDVALPADGEIADRMVGDLTAPRYRVVSGGRIQIEGKDEIRKRLGRSTDVGDAVVMAFWETFSPATIRSAAGMGLRIG